MWLYPREVYSPDFHIQPSVSEIIHWTSPVDVVYAGVTAGSLKDSTWLAWYRDLKANLKSQGIKLFAGGGEAWWGQQPAVSNYTAASWAVSVLQPTEAEGSTTRLFDGVMLDVEPYGAWNGNPSQAALVDWFTMMRDVKGEVSQSYCNPDGSAAAEVWCALPTWLHNYGIRGVGRSFDLSLMSLCDGVSFMVSRDTPSAIMGVSVSARRSCFHSQTPYRFTLETINPFDELGRRRLEDFETYYGSTQRILFADMLTVRTSLASDPLFMGFDIHHFDSWRAIEE